MTSYESHEMNVVCFVESEQWETVCSLSGDWSGQVPVGKNTVSGETDK